METASNSEPEKPSPLIGILGYAVVAVGIVALAAGVWRFFHLGDQACTSQCSTDYSPIVYFVVALVAFGWNSIESFKYKDYELKRTIDRAKREVAETTVTMLNQIKEQELAMDQRETGAVYATSRDGTTEPVDALTSSKRKRRLAPIEVNLPPPRVKDDPQKGRFGGNWEANGRKVQASVATSGSFFTVDVWVEPLPGAPPLVGQVDFYVHDTFPRLIYSVMAKDGKAEYDFFVSGAFTLGVVCDSGKTLLELDLANLSSAPKKFRES